MPLVCPICRDGLEGSCLENIELGLVAGECGHVFHKRCLCRWIEQGGTSTSSSKCPCCRGNVSVNKFISLFPTACNDVSMTDSSEDFETLKSTISDLNSKIVTLNENIKERDQETKDLRVKIDELNTQHSNLLAANKVWMKLSEKNTHYKNLCGNLKAKVQALEHNLNRHKSVGNIINKEQPFSSAIINASECCKEAAQSLIEENKMLSKEMQNSKADYQKLKDEYDSLKITFDDTNIQLLEFLR